MKFNKNKDWVTSIENLLVEVKAAEKVYGTLVTADVYPHKRPYFKKRHFKMAYNGMVLEDELDTITGGQYSKPDTAKGSIFEPMETMILEKSMSNDEVDALILQKEQELVQSYQKVLTYQNLPEVTIAILQSQAEEVNNLLLELKIDLQIETYKRIN